VNKAGRVTLVRSVLTAIPIYFLIVFALRKWALKRMIGYEELSCGEERRR
jgi:hypothetical protein